MEKHHEQQNLAHFQDPEIRNKEKILVRKTVAQFEVGLNDIDLGLIITLKNSKFFHSGLLF